MRNFSGLVTKRELCLIVSLFFLLTGSLVWANNQSQFSQTINAGTLSVDIVDAGGTTVASPSVTMGAENFSYSNQDATGTFGTSSERVRASNPTGTDTWTVNLAGSATTAVWTDGSNTYDFNDDQGYSDGTDTDGVGGQMTVNPSGGTVTGVSGCSTSNVTAGTSDLFEEGATDNIDLFSAAAGAATFCQWELTGVSITQGIPGSTPASTYTITMVLSIQ